MKGAIPAVILAGGRSRRMGGGRKYLLELDGQTLLERTFARLRPQTAEILLNLNDPDGMVFSSEIAIRPDCIEGFLGPLAGILTGLDYFAGRGITEGHMLSVPTDVPFLPGDLVSRLSSNEIVDKETIVMARSGDRTHPVIALWPLSIIGALRHALMKDNLRKVTDFTARYPCQEVEWPIGNGDPFFNINRPEDMELARERVKNGCS
ncbi:MAG: molybdenum cofactor guanylyltransferase MobA [Sneathiella sp.]|uniref:molybdenum cofactor guanylyltransferase MobA n=1 Tax=Sneathiella sp. TaxID=1964365 RepID=UPI000C5C05DE|nr:molybdenum cofactor guanylyltransferase MobA [Sneathiella sp.]MAL77597.1 molybdenum cofactor guanylyltransferase MobA [Sneathiella sp.]